MLNPPALAPAVVAARPQAIALSTVVFRSIHLRHFSNFAAAQPLFAAPGGLAGSRYIPPNGPAALYLAFDADTAHREGNQPYYQTAATPAGPALLHAGGLRPDPLVVIGVHVRLSHLLDLRDALTRLQLGIQAVTEILAPGRESPMPQRKCWETRYSTMVILRGLCIRRCKIPVTIASSFSPPDACLLLGSISSTR
jgi:hypothetical protein